MKITDFPAYTTQIEDDVLVIVDTVNDTTKKITLEQLFSNPFIPDDTITDSMLASTNFWQELGRTTLLAASDTISVTGLAAKKYLLVLIEDTAAGGTSGVKLRFNNDSGNNYAYRSNGNGGGDATTVNTNGIQITGSSNGPHFSPAFITNVATAEKILTASVVEAATAGAAAAPDRREIAGKWVNTSNQITRVDAINSGAGDFAIGSTLIVLGHD